MHNLKERLEPVKLSEAQKERILRNAKEERMEIVRPRYRKGPLIASVLVGMAVLFLMFNLLTEPQTILQPGGSQAATKNREGSVITMKILVWNIVASVFLLIATFATKKALLHVQRWQANAIVLRLKPIFESKPQYILLNIVLLTVIFGGGYLLQWSTLYVYTCVVVYFVIGMFMFEAYHTRENGWCSCPHCDERFTRKQMRKKTIWQFREKCDACQKPIFFDRKKAAFMTYMVAPSFMTYYSIFNFHFILVTLMIIAHLWLHYRYIMPYSIQFSAEPLEEEDQKLW